MKLLRNILVGLLLLAVVALALLWFLPVRWVMPWIEPSLDGVRLQQVHGSVWNGGAREVLDAGGKPLGAVHWRLSRRALLGEWRGQLALDGPPLTVSGVLRRQSDGQIEIDDLRLHAGLADLAQLEAYAGPPFGRPLGEVQLSAGRVLLQGGWPMQGQAHGEWRHAAVRTPNGDLALGAMQVEAEARGGVIQAQWHDVGSGPLQAKGNLQLSPLGWRLDTTLRAREDDPALRRWLAGLGPAASDGSVHIQQRGGLAGSLPSPDTGATSR